jgi:MFS family permease
MSRFQIIAIAVTVTLSTLEGFDLLSVTFAAPAIAHFWHVGKAALGILLATGLIGMAVGSLLLAPFADVVGRRAMMICGVLLMAAGMFLSAYAPSLHILALYRIITGAGVGSMVPITNALVAEYANVRRRPLAVSINTIGFPLGGLIGGIGSSILLAHYGWQAVFLAGFAASLIILPLAFIFLHEPAPSILARRRPNALKKLNALLSRAGHPLLTELPMADDRPRLAYSAIFAPVMIKTTTRMALVNILYIMATYYLLSWMPTLIADSGFRPSTASLVTACSSITAIIGGISLGFLANSFSLKWMTVTSVIIAGLMTAVFGLVPPALSLFVSVSIVSGLFAGLAASGLYSTLALVFPPQARSAGIGLIVGLGRIASAIPPLFAGWLFSLGLGREPVSCIFAASAVLAGLVLMTVRNREFVEQGRVTHSGSF